MNIEDIRIESMIGRGAMGSVYKGFQPAFDRVVAVKIPHAHLYFKPATLQRFKREAVHAAALQHPNIVQVFQLKQTPEEIPALVMEYVEGRTLSEVLKERVRLPESEVISIFTQILDALEHAHTHGIMHRDLKPANVMLLPSGVVKLMDLGLAKSLNADPNGQAVTDTGELVGTPMYMSPEQAEGHTYDERCDLYAVGCMLFETIEGAPPFCADTALELLMKHMESTTPSAVHASPALASVINRALAKDPPARFSTAAAMNEAVLAAQQDPGKTLFEKETSRSSKITKQPRRTKPLLAATLVLVALMIFALLRLNRPAPNAVPNMQGSLTAGLPPRAQGAQALMETAARIRVGWDERNYRTPEAKQADYELAERYLRQAVASSSTASANPRDKVNALSELGEWVGKDTKRKEEARSLLKRASELYPDTEESRLALVKSYAMIRLGWSLANDGRNKEAESWLKRAIAECDRPIDPAIYDTCTYRVNGLNNLADFYNATGDPVNAEKYGRAAFNLYTLRGEEYSKPGLETAQLLGKYLNKLHRNKEALSILSKAVEGAYEEAHREADEERVFRLHEILVILSTVYHDLGQEQKAQAMRAYAASIERKKGDAAATAIRKMALLQ